MLGPALALALGAGALAPAAHAGDFGRGPVYGNGHEPGGPPTPVPAPIPVPVYEPEWYFRADFAADCSRQAEPERTNRQRQNFRCRLSSKAQ